YRCRRRGRLLWNADSSFHRRGQGDRPPAHPAFRRTRPHHATGAFTGADTACRRRQFERAALCLSEDGACFRQSPPPRHLRRGGDESGGRASLRAFPQMPRAGTQQAGGDGLTLRGVIMTMHWITRGSIAAALCGVSFALAASAGAQDFPQRPITFVVGLGAGGGQDVNSRIFADAMSRSLGQRIVVDNKTGAGGGVAASYVQNAAPDGYKLFTGAETRHLHAPPTQPGLYDPIKGFAPVSLMFEIISTLAVP